MEELIEGQADILCDWVLGVFGNALQLAMTATGSLCYARSSVGIYARRVDRLGKLGRLRDQGDAMCTRASLLCVLERPMEAQQQYQRARDVGEAHSFFSVECQACLGLGRLAMNDGRHEPGVEPLQNALVHPVPQTLQSQPSTRNPQPNTLNPKP